MMHARTKFQHCNESHGENSQRRATLIFASLLMVVILPFISGCGKNKDDGNVDQGFAVTPIASPSTSCAAGATYKGDDWAQVPHSQVNMTPYGYGVHNYQPDRHRIQTEGYCGCPQGTQAMCDSSHGVVCMPVDYLRQQDVQWFHQSQQGFHVAGFGGYTGYTNVFDPRTNLPPPTHYGHFRRPPSYPQPGHPGAGYGGRHGHPRHQAQPVPALSCSTQIGQTCTVGVNTCSHGAHCRPVRQGYSIGICAR